MFIINLDIKPHFDYHNLIDYSHKNMLFCSVTLNRLLYFGKLKTHIRGFRFLNAGFYCPHVPYFIPRQQNGSILCFWSPSKLLRQQLEVVHFFANNWLMETNLKYQTARKRSESNIYQQSSLEVFEWFMQLNLALVSLKSVKNMVNKLSTKRKCCRFNTAVYIRLDQLDKQ